MLNQVHDYLGYVPLERINAMSATPGRKWQPFSITLSGGQEFKAGPMTGADGARGGG
jgi:hypothetical protein